MSFIRNYLKFCDNNECPEIFHMWSAISTLSVIAGRRFWFTPPPPPDEPEPEKCTGLFTIHPNMYVVLVGGPGSGKTTAMDVSKGTIRKIGKIVIAATSATKESMCKDMTPDDSPHRKSFTSMVTNKIEEYTQCAIFATELIHFISVNPLGWIDFLTTIYDQEVYDVSTKGQGKDYIPGPYITLLGCMTPEVTGQLVKASIISGGFSSRCIFIWADASSKEVPFPYISPASKAAIEQCIEWGQKLAKLNGPFSFGPGGYEWYVNWYKDYKVECRNNKIRCMDPFFARKRMMIWKVGMLIALSEGTDRILTPSILELANKLLTEASKDMHKVFIGAGANPTAAAAAEIENTIMTFGQPIKFKMLFEMYFDKCDRKTFEDILAALQAQEKIQIVEREDTTSSGQKYTCRYVMTWADYMQTQKR